MARTDRITDLAWIGALYELGQKAANGAHPQQVRQEISSTSCGDSALPAARLH
jgi:hypothetical protein